MRASLWIWMGFCISMLGCRPREVLLEGDVIVGDLKLGSVDVELIPAEPMNALLAANAGIKFSEGRPAARFSVKTDLEGSFFLKVAPGPYAVFAHASRMNGTEKQEYTWLFWNTVEADGAQPRLLLNNDNLSDSGCAQCIPIAREQKADEVRSAPAPVRAVGPIVGKEAPGEMVVMGSLDRKLIHLVIQRNRGQIRYCYESQLIRIPNLRGNVLVKFVIAPTGAVATSTIAQSTVNNAEVEACITGRVRTWMFPKPKGGGVVIVSYPFKLQQGG